MHVLVSYLGKFHFLLILRDNCADFDTCTCMRQSEGAIMAYDRSLMPSAMLLL